MFLLVVYRYVCFVWPENRISISAVWSEIGTRIGNIFVGSKMEPVRFTHYNSFSLCFEDTLRPNKKNMCVSGYRPSLSLSHRPWVFHCRFWFFITDFSRRKMFSVSSLFLLHLILKITSLKVFLSRLRTADNTSAEIKPFFNSQWKWSSNEPWHHVTDWKCRYTSSVFIKYTSGKSKIISKNKKIIRPTYPNFKKHITGNTYIFVCLALA